MLTSGFFNGEKIGVDEYGAIYDRMYQAEFFSRYFSSFISNGVFGGDSTSFQVVENSGMSLRVKGGRAFINGYFCYSDEDIILNLDESDGLEDRIDRIVLQLNLSDREISLKILKGDIKTPPEATEITRSGDIYELAIADILIEAGTPNIENSKITDLRLNNELCGFVTHVLEKVDTTTLYNQIQEDLKEFKEVEEANFLKWFEDIKSKLNENAVSEHIATSIFDENGVHDLRYNREEEKFQGFNLLTQKWDDLAGGIGEVGFNIADIPYIKITTSQEGISIIWKDPKDTIISGVTFAKWKGTLLIKKEGTPPLSIEDGEILVDSKIHNQYYQEPYVDNNIRNNTIYYYAIFPYSEDEKVNTNINNIRGASRQGDSIPLPVQNIRTHTEIRKVSLNWEEPTDINTWFGTRVVRKIGTPPINQDDGEIILINKQHNKYKTTPFVDETANKNAVYYYGIFTFTINGVFNTDSQNVVSVIPSLSKIYSFEINLNESDPSRSITYLDESTKYTTPESWDQCPLFAGLRPCILKNGKVKYYLDPNDYERKLDGTYSDLTGIDGDAMVEFPAIVYRVEEKTNDKIKFNLTIDEKLASSGEGWNALHLEYEGMKKFGKKMYISIYVAEEDKLNNTLVSIASRRTGLFQGKRLEEILNLLKRKTPNTFAFNFYAYELILLLTMLRFKTTDLATLFNLQEYKTLGLSEEEKYKVGDLTKGGLFSGCGSETPQEAIKLCGIEFYCSKHNLNFRTNILLACTGFYYNSNYAPFDIGFTYNSKFSDPVWAKSSWETNNNEFRIQYYEGLQERNVNDLFNNYTNDFKVLSKSTFLPIKSYRGGVNPTSKTYLTFNNEVVANGYSRVASIILAPKDNAKGFIFLDSKAEKGYTGLVTYFMYIPPNEEDETTE